MTTTFVLTRKPDVLFTSSLSKSMKGRFGTLLVLQGGKIEKVAVSSGNTASASSGAIQIPAGVLDITTSDGSAVQELKRYTTIERMGGYVQLKPQDFNGKHYKNGAYGIAFETGNKVVATLRGTDGKCFRIYGGVTAQEQAILIHEAPDVSWLIGCIGPRNLSDRSTGTSKTSHATMNELFSIFPRPSALFVLDW
ncbi:MAG TPA: hypothetical protein VKU01_24415 [Bryobacteraceae bacterium]|nr:hypothetical protein [Bryobacteraceae bacterium]